MKKQIDSVLIPGLLKLTAITVALLVTHSTCVFAQNGKVSNFKIEHWSFGGDVHMALPKNHADLPAFGVQLRGSVYFTNNYVVSANFLLNDYFKSDNYPHDYQGGGWFSLGDPGDRIRMLTTSFGKRVNTNLDMLRFTFEGGVSLIQYQEAQYTEKHDNCFLFCTSHTVSYPEKQFGVGLNLRTKAEFNWTWIAGSYWVFDVNLNSKQSYFSFGAGMQFGKVRDQL